MKPWFLLAALLALATTALHAIAGWRQVVIPLRPGADRKRFAVIEAAWHIITWHLAVLTLALGYLAWRTLAVLADLVMVSALGYALIFAGLSWRYFRRLLVLPQWTLFLALALLTSAGTHPWPPLAAAAARPAALIAGVIFAAIALLHVYWALGGLWPGHDADSLTRTVVGQVAAKPPGKARGPGPALTALVALVLAFAAALVLGVGGWLPLPGPRPPLVTVAGWALAAGFLLRGLGGFFEIYLRPSIVGTPYCYWNRVLYSPLALTLSLLVSLTLVS